MEAKTANERLARLVLEMRQERAEYLADVELCDRMIQRGGFASMTVADLELIRCGHRNTANTLTPYIDEAEAIVFAIVEEQSVRQNAPREG